MRTLTPVFGLLLLFCVACGGDSAPAKATPANPAQMLRLVQENLREAGGHRLRFEQSNFVLPQWGGIDNGVIEISRDGKSAKATLTRTGEPGATYTITLSGGKTYFQRSTCPQTFVIPGGGADVLKPFLFVVTNALGDAKDPQWYGEAIHAVVDGLGPVDIVVEEKPGRLEEIRGDSNHRPQVWHVEAWGVTPSVSVPSGDIQERGPGGNPC